eukprot:2922-Heterococcus_DN1.PRE.7
MRQPMLILVAAARVGGFMPNHLLKSLASAGLLRHIYTPSVRSLPLHSTILQTARLSTEVEIVSAQLKARLAELPGSITDKQLETMDVKAFTALCSTLRGHLDQWQQQVVMSDLTRRYLALCKDPSTMVEALLALKDNNPEHLRQNKGKNPLHCYSKEVLDFMLNYKEKCPAETYAAVWNADIPWTREEVRQLPVALIDSVTLHPYEQMVARPTSSTNGDNTDNSDDCDDDEDRSYPQCSNRELLLVSWLLDRDDVDTTKLVKLYTAWVDQRMNYLPLRIKKFDSGTDTGGSDLLSSINSYYSTDAIVSPAIVCRRNILLLSGNEYAIRGSIERYKTQFSKTTESITIEMPYMCYIIPSSIEVQVDAFTRDENNPIKPEQLSVTFGKEYLLLGDHDIREREQTTDRLTSRKLCSVVKEVNCQ